MQVMHVCHPPFARSALRAQAAHRPRCPHRTQADVGTVLAGYKELLLRYEALCLCLRSQLSDGSTGAAPGLGFGSFFIPGKAEHGSSLPPSPRPLGASGGGAGASSEARGSGAGRSLSEPLDAAAAAAAVAVAGVPPSASGSPSKWSPTGLLQRISSKAGRSAATSRSSTPTRGERGEGFVDSLRSVSPVARLAATGKQVAQHPIFHKAFGRSKGGGSSSPYAASSSARQSQEDDAQQEPLAEGLLLASAVSSAAEQPSAGAAAEAPSSASLISLDGSSTGQDAEAEAGAGDGVPRAPAVTSEERPLLQLNDTGVGSNSTDAANHMQQQQQVSLI